MTRCCHAPFVCVISKSHGLIVLVVPYDRKHGDMVPGLSPEAGCAVHDRAVSDGTYHLPVGRREFRAGRGSDTPAKTRPGVAEPHLLVRTMAESEGLVSACEILADNDCLGIERSGHHSADLVRMYRRMSEVLSCDRLALPACCHCIVPD